MPEGDPAHGAAGPSQAPHRRSRRGRWMRRSTSALVVLVLVAAGVSYHFDLAGRWLGHTDRPSPVKQPALVLPPVGLSLPEARAVSPVAAARPERAVDGAAVRRAVASLVARKKLGRHVVVDVAQLSDGTIVYHHGTGTVMPASTMKMLTTVAALRALGPQHRFTTRVVATASSARIVLVGGGDPLLARTPASSGTYPARADLDTLATATAKRLRALGRSRVRLGYDTSLFSGPRVDPTWEPDYISTDVISPITSLWVNEGRVANGLSERSPDPAQAAAQDFAEALASHHIKVLGTPTEGPAPRSAAAIASVRGAPLAEVVQHILEVSDNEGAEVLSHQVAVARHLPATFANGAKAVRAVLASIKISTAGDVITDGSGLSRHDRLRPQTLLAVIRTSTSPQYPDLHTAVANLPVAGFTGSLAARFTSGNRSGPGMVRAKTGTLTGVHGLTGTVTSRDGAVMSFVAIADHVKPANTLDARQIIDQLTAALAGCLCAG